MEFFTQQKFEARVRELEKYRFTDMQAVTPFAAMEETGSADEAHLRAPDKIDGMTLSLEDEFNGRDRYLWAEKTLTLPECRDGCEVYGAFDFGTTGGGHNSGFESLLYLDGEPYQGVDSNHPDVNFNRLGGKTVRLTFLLWSGLEGGGPETLQRHTIKRAEVGYLHTATDSLYYLARTVVKTIAALPDSAVEKHALSAAVDDMLRLINWDADKFYDTVQPALSCLLRALEAIPKHRGATVNVVGHTHIDVAWLWRLKHTREKALRSFSTVLRLMDEFDEYIFLQTQPQLYQYIKTDYPELYDKIKAKIREGCWEADGGMWVEADCNIPSGEALIRQLTHGIRFFMREFGVRCRYLWLPDVFGYSWALPQILGLAGIKTFMTTKISWNQHNIIPADLFRWRGIDGSEILTYFISTPEEERASDEERPENAGYSTYNGTISPVTVMGSWQRFKNKSLSGETLISYGFGDGGGGVNRDMLKTRRAMELIPGLPDVCPCAAGDFFERLHQNTDDSGRYIHTWDGELYLEYHRGTYTSQAYSKWMNRKLELAAVQCEWLSCLGYLGGGEYPADKLDSAWKTVLLHQFHDIIPGSSIREVYADSRINYSGAQALLDSLTEKAADALITPLDNSFAVVNSGSFDRDDIVLLPITEDGVFKDSGGAELPAQRTDGGWLVQVSIPALAMQNIGFEPCACAQPEGPFKFSAENRVLETPLYILRWDENGFLDRLIDKQHQRQVLAGTANVLEIYEDKPLEYDNWNIDIFYHEKREAAALSAPPTLLENGPLRAVAAFEYRYNLSTFRVEMTVYSDCPRIDFVTRVQWQETNRLLKAAFPVDIRSPKATYDIQLGHVERPTHWNTSWDLARFEVVGHKWADLSDADYGVSLLNDCKYGYSIKDNVMRLTLLKSTKHPDTQMDMGEHRFTYSLLPHTDTAAYGGTIEQAIMLNQPLWAAAGTGDGRRLIKLGSDCAQIDAVKKAEDESCVILRLHECRGARGRISITSDYKLKSFAPCDLLEENLAEPVCSDAIHCFIRPFEIKTFKLWFAE